MYRISLLPEKYRLQRVKAAQRLDLIIYFLFFTVICLILLTLATVVRFHRASELDRLNSEIVGLQLEIESLSVYAQKKDNVEQAYKDITFLASGLPSFPKVVPEILGTVPDNISIENVSLQYVTKTDTTIMEISGEALDYDDVAGWINILDGLQLTGEILNSYSTGKSSESTYNVSFELSIKILDDSAVNDITWDLGE